MLAERLTREFQALGLRPPRVTIAPVVHPQWLEAADLTIHLMDGWTIHRSLRVRAGSPPLDCVEIAGEVLSQIQLSVATVRARLDAWYQERAQHLASGAVDLPSS